MVPSWVDKRTRSEGVRTRDWKYVRYIDQAGVDAEELYHLKADPLEMKDLSDDPGSVDVLKQMRERFLNDCETWKKLEQEIAS